MDDTLLEVVQLTKAFGGLVAVSDLSFTVKRGQIKAIIGPNGAGKTTCLNLISGTFRPTAGEIRFKNTPVTNLSPHERAYLRITAGALARMFAPEDHSGARYLIPQAWRISSLS